MVATPARLLYHLREKSLTLRKCFQVAIDEADALGLTPLLAGAANGVLEPLRLEDELLTPLTDDSLLEHLQQAGCESRAVAK